MLVSQCCPICENPQMVMTVKREKLPAMQNYVFNKKKQAKNIPCGKFTLAVCPACGFACNIDFDPSLLRYDEGYDNSVSSNVMVHYYEEIAAYLHQKYASNGGLVIDIGCGKGTFLKMVTEMFPDLQGLGIDPSYEPDNMSEKNKRVRFIKDFFQEQYIPEKPALVICRHVLEHIQFPLFFLKSIERALKKFPGVPFFLEVPDLWWIIENGIFLDFCYEHCNYFTHDSIACTLEIAGFSTEMVQNAFEGQYLWCEAKTALSLEDTVGCKTTPSQLIDALTCYSKSENLQILETREKIQSLKNDGYTVAVWGMATKGVVFSYLIDPDDDLVDFCVDVNKTKQGCYVPVTGHRIESPDALCKASPKSLVVIVMNPAYLFEIKELCSNLNLKATFMDVKGEIL
ncbi:MAG: methyltransferase domain-containing protein [Anaerolineae bacterium]|nr:methyltransferase domain-containing protein [Anaerolineae bacterium]